MIQRGRTRRASLLGLDAHERFARQRALTQRLRRAAWGALAGSVLYLLLVILTTKALFLILVPIMAAIGFALPLQDQRKWARRYLAQHHGLSYETALEAGGKADPYGLWSASTEVAVQTVRKGDPPPTDWRWLPVSVLTLLLLVLSPLIAAQTEGVREALVPGNAAAAQPQSSSPESNGSASNPGEPTGAADEAAAAPAAQASDAPDAPRAVPEPTADTGAGDAEEPLGLDASASGDPGAPPAVGEEAIDRFLAQAQQRASPEEDESQGGRSEDADGEGATSGSPREANGQDENAQGEAGSTPGDGDAASEGAAEDATEIAVPSDDPAERDANQAGDPSSDDTNQPGAGASQEGEPSDDMGNAGSSPPRGGEEPGIDDAFEGGDEGQDARGENASGSEAGQAPSDTASGDGEAGNRPGNRQASDLADGESSLNAESLNLESPEGPRAAAGVTVDRGVAPGDAPPTVSQGLPAATDARDAERIAEETNLPSVYREIIRRYFR